MIDQFFQLTLFDLGKLFDYSNYVSFFNKLLVYNVQDNIENRGKVWKAQMCRQQLLHDKHSMYFLFSFLLSSLPYSLFAPFLSSFFLLNYPLDQLRIFGHGAYVTNLPWGNCMCTIYSSIYHFDGNSLLYKHLSLDYKETTWRLNNKALGEPRRVKHSILNK